MEEVEFAGEVRGGMSVKKEDETDIRFMVDKSGLFDKEFGNIKLPSMFESPVQ